MPSFDEILNKGSSSEALKKKIEKRKAYRERLRLPKGMSYQEVLEDYYIGTEAEKTSLKAKVVDKAKDLGDLIDNFNRVQYTIFSTIERVQKDVKYDREFSGKRLLKAAKKGWQRKNKPEARELIRNIAPEFIKESEEFSQVKILGMNVDALTPAMAAATIFSDPVTYIPFGLPAKLVGKMFKLVGKGAKAASEAVIGVENVAKALSSAEKTLYNKILPHVNIGPILKRKRSGESGVFTLEDIGNTFKETMESTPLKVERKLVDAMTISETKFGPLTFRRLVDKEGSKKILKNAQGSGDKIVEEMGPAYAKFVGLHVDDVMDARRVEDILTNGVEEGVLTKEALGEIGSLLKGKQKSFAKFVTDKIAEKRGLKLVSKQLANAERDATLAAEKLRFETTKSILEPAIKNRLQTFKILEQDLKNNSRSLLKLMEKDISDSSRIVDDVFKDMSEAIQSGSQVSVNQMKANLVKLRSTIKNMVSEEIDITRGVQKLRAKSEAPLRHLEVLVRRLEQSTGEAIVGKLNQRTSKLIENVKTIGEQAKKELNKYRAFRRQELKSLGGKMKLTSREHGELLSQYKVRTENVLRDHGFLMKELAKSKRRYQMAVGEVIPKTAARQAREYEKAFNAISDASHYQKFLNSFRARAEKIIADDIATLPKDLQKPAWKAREILDEMKVKLESDKIMKGVPFGYAPRALMSRFAEEYSGSVSRQGFLKHRRFKTEKEFSEWAAKSGFKPEEDGFMLIYNNMLAADMKIARKNMKDGIEGVFGGDKNIPIDVKKAMEWMFHPFSKLHQTPFVGPVMSVYGSVLHFTKTMLTGMNPAFYGRNILGYPRFAATEAGWQAMLPWNALSNSTDAIRVMGKAKGSVTGISFDDIRKATDDFGYFSSSFTRGNIEKGFKAIAKRRSKMLPMYWIEQAFAMSANVEDFGRMSALMANLKSSMNIKAATVGGKLDKAKLLRSSIVKAQRSMFDYNIGLLSPMDKAIDGVMGFWSFRRRNIPQQIRTVFNDPKQYAILSKALNSISNRESMTDEEIELLNTFQKDSFLIFGQAIDGVREVTRLGFTPEEDIVQTLRPLISPGTIPDRLRGLLGGRINPLLGSFMDLYYRKSSFTNQEFGNQLPEKYTHVIKGGLRDVLGFTEVSRPKYKFGQIVGKKKVLVGPEDSVWLVRNFAPWSRTLGDMAGLIDHLKKGKKGKGIAKFGFGVSTHEFSREKQKKMQEAKLKKAKVKRMKEKGVKTLEIPYVDKITKEKIREHLKSRRSR